MGFVLWGVFLYYWYLVGRRPLNRHTTIALYVIGIMVAVTTVLVIWWIIHNIRLHRKLQRRRLRLDSSEPRRRDYAGRWLTVDDKSNLTRSGYIEIETREKEKVFHTFRRVPR